MRICFEEMQHFGIPSLLEYYKLANEQVPIPAAEMQFEQPWQRFKSMVQRPLPGTLYGRTPQETTEVFEAIRTAITADLRMADPPLEENELPLIAQ